MCVVRAGEQGADGERAGCGWWPRGGCCQATRTRRMLREGARDVVYNLRVFENLSNCGVMSLDRYVLTQVSSSE